MAAKSSDFISSSRSPQKNKTIFWHLVERVKYFVPNSQENDVQTVSQSPYFLRLYFSPNTHRSPIISQDDGDLEAHAFDELAPALKLADALQMPEVWGDLDLNFD